MSAKSTGIDRDRLLAEMLRGAFPDARGRFGPYGGRYVPETLVPALDRLEAGARSVLADRAFRAEFESELRGWRVAHAPHPRTCVVASLGSGGVAQREDLAHTGRTRSTTPSVRRCSQSGRRAPDRRGNGRRSARCRLGRRVRAARDAVCRVHGRGRHGAAGAERRPHETARRRSRAGDERRPHAARGIDEALRDWVGDPDGTYYLLGSAVGPHPYPYLVREFQSVIGIEARAQMLDATGKLPDIAVACVGGGSNAMACFIRSSEIGTSHCWSRGRR